jgi:hypothetical protein
MASTYAALHAACCAAIATASPATSPYVAGEAEINAEKFRIQLSNKLSFGGMYGAAMRPIYLLFWAVASTKWTILYTSCRFPSLYSGLVGKKRQSSVDK